MTRILSASSFAITGMSLKMIGGAKRAGPIGRIAHLLKLGCSLDTLEKESKH